MQPIIITVLVLLVWKLSDVVIRLENYSYAGAVQMCYEAANYGSDIAARDRREKCLRATQTRTSNAYHLLYALGLL